MNGGRAPARFRLSGDAPVVEPLAGRPLAVHLVVNLEHWDLAEPMPRAVLPAPHGRALVPDVANFSWVLSGGGGPGQPPHVLHRIASHLMGVAHRAAEMARIVRWLAERRDVVFATSGRLADWWTAQVPAPPEDA